MQQLWPEYTQWRTRDLYYVWTWKEALSSIVTDTQKEIILLMFWIVKRRFFELIIASKVKPNHLLYSDYWKYYRALPLGELCVACPNRKEFDKLSESLWREKTIRVISASHYGGDHSTLTLRLEREEVRLMLVVFGGDLKSEKKFSNICLIDKCDTIWCQYRVLKGDEVNFWAMPLMQLY